MKLLCATTTATSSCSSSSSLVLLGVIIISNILPVAGQPFTDVQCYAGLPLLALDYNDIDNFSKAYNEESVFMLKETGAYIGPDDIAEYVNFRSASSPFIDRLEDGNALKNQFLGVNPDTGICELRLALTLRNWLSPTTAVNASFTAAYLMKFQYNITSGYVNRINLYFTPEFLEFFLGQAIQTENTMRTVCEIMEQKCPSVYAANGNLTTEACVERLFALPATSAPGNRINGNDRGCRVLHSTFASVNPTEHCAHLSFIPMEDPKGRIKCQEPKNNEGLFEQADLDWYYDVVANETDLPDTGFIVHYAEYPDENDLPPVPAPTPAPVVAATPDDNTSSSTKSSSGPIASCGMLTISLSAMIIMALSLFNGGVLM